MAAIDLNTFSQACGELYAPGLNPGNFAARGFAFLRRLVQAEFSGCGRLDHRTRHLTIGFDTEHTDFASAMEAYGTVMGRYEIYNFDPSVNAGRPFRRSQFFSHRQFRDLDIYQEVYVPLGIDNHCAVHVPTQPDETCFFFLERKGGPDYTNHELTLLAQAQSHLANAHAVGQACVEQAEDPTEPALLTRAGFTPREADVLCWLVQGKSNVEIPLILGISLHTVKDHLAAIFNKLGVDNRFTVILRTRELVRILRVAPPDDDPRFIKLAVL